MTTEQNNAVEGTDTEEALGEIAFAKAHSEICTATSPRSERSHREGRKEFSPSDKRHCGKQLYRFLVNNGLELDINHPHNHDNK